MNNLPRPIFAFIYHNNILSLFRRNATMSKMRSNTVIGNPNLHIIITWSTNPFSSSGKKIHLRPESVTYDLPTLCLKLSVVGQMYRETKQDGPEPSIWLTTVNVAQNITFKILLAGQASSSSGTSTVNRVEKDMSLSNESLDDSTGDPLYCLQSSEFDKQETSDPVETVKKKCYCDKQIYCFYCEQDVNHFVSIKDIDFIDIPKKCTENPDTSKRQTAQSDGQTTLVATSLLKYNNLLAKELFPHMRADDINLIAKKNMLICQYLQ
nr:unnamed protein product [Callosobruchus analis]